MKTIGLIGGMTWMTSLEYYKIINEIISEKTSGEHNAKSILHTFDFYEIELLALNRDWQKLEELIFTTSENLINAGAEYIVLCSNTSHLVFEEVQNKIPVPILHIADSTGKKIVSDNLRTVCLLGTKTTMTKEFITKILKEKYNLNVLPPDGEDIEIINNIIFDELVKGRFESDSKLKLIGICDKLTKQGSQGIILGCTDLRFILSQDDFNIPVYDTALIHAEDAALYAL